MIQGFHIIVLNIRPSSVRCSTYNGTLFFGDEPYYLYQSMSVVSVSRCVSTKTYTFQNRNLLKPPNNRSANSDPMVFNSIWGNGQGQD